MSQTVLMASTRHSPQAPANTVIITPSGQIGVCPPPASQPLFGKRRRPPLSIEERNYVAEKELTLWKAANAQLERFGPPRQAVPAADARTMPKELLLWLQSGEFKQLVRNSFTANPGMVTISSAFIRERLKMLPLKPNLIRFLDAGSGTPWNMSFEVIQTTFAVPAEVDMWRQEFAVYAQMFPFQAQGLVLPGKNKLPRIAMLLHGWLVQNRTGRITEGFQIRESSGETLADFIARTKDGPIQDAWWLHIFRQAVEAFVSLEEMQIAHNNPTLDSWNYFEDTNEIKLTNFEFSTPRTGEMAGSPLFQTVFQQPPTGFIPNTDLRLFLHGLVESGDIEKMTAELKQKIQTLAAITDLSYDTFLETLGIQM